MLSSQEVEEDADVGLLLGQDMEVMDTE